MLLRVIALVILFVQTICFGSLFYSPSPNTPQLAAKMPSLRSRSGRSRLAEAFGVARVGGVGKARRTLRSLLARHSFLDPRSLGGVCNLFYPSNLSLYDCVK